jgi:hypothetical protein
MYKMENQQTLCTKRETPLPAHTVPKGFMLLHTKQKNIGTICNNLFS